MLKLELLNNNKYTEVVRTIEKRSKLAELSVFWMLEIALFVSGAIINVTLLKLCSNLAFYFRKTERK